MKFAFLILPLLFVFGCASPLEQGFTECSGEICQPGQYCSEEVCENGCTSDINCESDKECGSFDAADRVGICEEKPGETQVPDSQS